MTHTPTRPINIIIARTTDEALTEYKLPYRGATQGIRIPQPHKKTRIRISHALTQEIEAATGFNAYEGVKTGKQYLSHTLINNETGETTDVMVDEVIYPTIALIRKQTYLQGKALVGHANAKGAWSRTADCACGCSPAYVMETRGRDITIASVALPQDITNVEARDLLKEMQKTYLDGLTTINARNGNPGPWITDRLHETDAVIAHLRHVDGMTVGMVESFEDFKRNMQNFLVLNCG